MGKVIQKDTQLSSSCHKEVVGLMEEAAPLVAADPILEEMCPKSIERCKLETNGKGDLEIHECLKRLFGKEQLEDGRACSRLEKNYVQETVDKTRKQNHPTLSGT